MSSPVTGSSGAIGRGGMSVAHLAEDIELGRNDAMKVPTGHLADEENFRERFMHERKTLASLEHPNIVRIYHAGEEGGCLYLAMQLIDGTDLGSVLGDGPIEPERLSHRPQVAAALDYAHQKPDEGHEKKDMVHRDVKPANILLSRPGAALEHAFLVDFGIAKGLE